MGIENSATNTQAEYPLNQGTTLQSPSPASGAQASIVEPRSPATPMNTDDMFLSPRVLDSGAFTRYSEMLKSIILKAGTQTRSLEDFSTDAQAMIKRCDVTSEAINKRMQAGLRMIKMIDERATRTEAILEQVANAGPNTQTIADEIDKLIEDRLDKAQKQADAIAAKAQQKVLDAEQRIEESQVKAQAHIVTSEGYALKLSELSTRVEQQLNELDARLVHTREETNGTLSEIIDRSQAACKDMETSLNTALARAHEAGSNLAVKIDESSMLTESRIAELNECIKPVVEASEQAMITLGMDPKNPVFEDSPLARVEQLVERGETQTASLDRVYRQLEDLQSQAEGIKAVFGVWLVDAAEDLDTLEERKEKIVGPMSEAADKINQLAPDLESNLELAATKLTHLQIEQQALRQTIQASTSVANEVSNRMTNETGQLQALLDGSIHKLSTRVEQAGVWLGALIQRAEATASGMPNAGVMNFGAQPTQEPAPIAPKPEPEPEPRQASPIQASPTQIQPGPVRMSIGVPAIQTQSIEEVGHEEACDIDLHDKVLDAVLRGVLEEPEQSSELSIPQPPCLPIDALGFGCGMIEDQ